MAKLEEVVQSSHLSKEASDLQQKLDNTTKRRTELLNQILICNINLGDWAGAKKTIEEGADANHTFRHEKSNQKSMPLFCSVGPAAPTQNASSKLSFVRCLLEHKAEVNAINHWKESPLLIAMESSMVVHGHPEYLNHAIIQLLLEHGADPNIRAKPLWFAIENKRSDLVELLLRHGAKPNLSYDSGWNALHAAIELRDLKLFNLLLEHGADIQALDRKKRTPLLHAVAVDFVEAAKRLIEVGADVDAVSEEWKKIHMPGFQEEKKGLAGSTSKSNHELSQVSAPPTSENLRESEGEAIHQEELNSRLISAIVRRDCGDARQAIGYGADVNRLDSHKNTPLYHAINLKSVDIVRLLLEKGVSASSPTPWGDGNFLHLISLYKDPSSKEIAKILLDGGASLTQKDGMEQTPLHVAARNKNFQLCKLFLKRGADPNAGRRDGNTPFHVAVDSNDLSLCELFLKHGADPNVADVSGAPLLTAMKQQNKALIELLIQYGADIYALAPLYKKPILSFAKTPEEQRQMKAWQTAYYQKHQNDPSKKPAQEKPKERHKKKKKEKTHEKHNEKSKDQSESLKDQKKSSKKHSPLKRVKGWLGK